MQHIPSNPEECTTPEAWAELVRTERVSAAQKHDELAAAEVTIARLNEQVAFLMRLIATGATTGKGG